MPLRLRLEVYIRRRQLDREIVAGRPWRTKAALALRAWQLTSGPTRRRLARDLRKVVAYVERPPAQNPIGCAVVIERRAVAAGRDALLGLAERLEGEGAVSPSGIVLATRLLTDGLGPLYNPNSGRTVIDAVWDVVDVLGGLAPVSLDG